MKGKRVFELLNELAPTEHRKLMYLCAKSEDKRLLILYRVLKLQNDTLEDFNQSLVKFTTQVFKDKSLTEIEHICRRNLDYYSVQIEDLIVVSQLTADDKMRNIVIADFLEKSANPFLLEHYYDKAFKSASLSNDSFVELKAIRGKIRLKFNTQSEASFREAVALNDSFKTDIERFYHDKYVDYYNNISNVYIESNLLIDTTEQKLIKEIDIKINQCDFLQYKIGYLISQARLCFRNEQFFTYINKAYLLLNESAIDLKSKNILKRKILFLELIIGFYFNKNQHNLIDVIDDILQINLENKFIDNNSMFHKLLLLILNDRTEEAMDIMSKEKNYFKGKSSDLKEFLTAMMFYKKSQINKCLKLVNELSYCSNYFISLFSKLLCIKIHIELKNTELTDSLLYNTERFIKRNPDKFTVYDSSLYTLYQFKIMNNKKAHKKNLVKSVPLSPFHLFLLQK